MIEMRYPYLYDMNRKELLDYLKTNLDFKKGTYPYINHDMVLNMNKEELREFIANIEDNEVCCTVVKEEILNV